jgi:cytochrome o ubiquinol oxidase operon protein cyoD
MDTPHHGHHDHAPGEDTGVAEGSHADIIHGVQAYILGLVLALILTATSFWAADTKLLWGPGVPIGLAVLAMAQIGIHLVFFLHITTGPDNTNNVLALAFGVMIVALLVAGSIWIMANLNIHMMPMGPIMDLHQQRG